jgi:hypothetical protein
MRYYCVVAVCCFGFFWVRSAEYCDDIFFGKRSIAFQSFGISRFRTSCRGVSMEFRPAMVTNDETRWLAFPPVPYCFQPSDNSVMEQIGFSWSFRDRTFGFPYWFLNGAATAVYLACCGRKLRIQSLPLTALVVATILGALTYEAHNKALIHPREVHPLPL